MRQGGGARNQHGGPSEPRSGRRGQPAPPQRLEGRLGLLLRPEEASGVPGRHLPGVPRPGARDPPSGLAPSDLTAPSPSSGFNGGSCSRDPALASSWPSGPFGPPLHSGDWALAVILTAGDRSRPRAQPQVLRPGLRSKWWRGYSCLLGRPGPLRHWDCGRKRKWAWAGHEASSSFCNLPPRSWIFHGPLFNPYHSPITCECCDHTPASQATNLQFGD